MHVAPHLLLRPTHHAHSWTEDALAAGAASLGCVHPIIPLSHLPRDTTTNLSPPQSTLDSFPAVAHGMFGRGAVELVEHFADRVDAAWLAQLEAQKGELGALPNARERLKLAVQLRLRLLSTWGLWLV